MEAGISVERGPAGVVARSRVWGVAAVGSDEREALERLGAAISLFRRLDERMRVGLGRTARAESET